MNLLDVRPGQKTVLKDFSSNQSVHFKLLSLGVLPGDQVEVMGRAPFGGPISIKHGSQTFFALRRNEAKLIDVEIQES
ncbi:MAG: ferrous iron transport protein A [Deltaproteobacteria bacterium]|jgi:ferrous iron transport protein A|nr:MAG: ferrous iron transport protein A [Deltaproteobacteria bacterium]